MDNADAWFACRIAYVEVVRAVTLSGYDADPARDEWAKFEIVDIDQDLAERAADVAVRHRLRSLDALHLASALTLPRDDLTVLTADRRLSDAATAEGLRVLSGP